MINGLELGIFKLLWKRFCSRTPKEAALIRNIATVLACISGLLAYYVPDTHNMVLMYAKIGFQFLTPFFGAIGVSAQCSTDKPELLLQQTIDNINATVQSADDLKKN